MVPSKTKIVLLTCRLRRKREKLGQGGRGLGHHILDGHLRPLSVERRGGGHGIHSRNEEVCLFTPGNERSMTMATFLLSSVESCGGDHGNLPENRRSSLLVLRRKR